MSDIIICVLRNMLDTEQEPLVNCENSLNAHIRL